MTLNFDYNGNQIDYKMEEKFHKRTAMPLTVSNFSTSNFDKKKVKLSLGVVVGGEPEHYFNQFWDILHLLVLSFYYVAGKVTYCVL